MFARYATTESMGGGNCNFLMLEYANLAALLSPSMIDCDWMDRPFALGIGCLKRRLLFFLSRARNGNSSAMYFSAYGIWLPTAKACIS